MKPIYILIIAVVIGLLGFFSGLKYSQSKIAANRQNLFRQMREGTNGQNMGRRFSGRPVSGEIVSYDENSITVKMPDGQSKIVLLNDTTQINQATAASQANLQKGVQVAVFGSENSDGSMTAQNIQLNPQFGRFSGANISPTPY